MFVSFRTRSDTPLTAGVAKTGPDRKGPDPVGPKVTVATIGPGVVGGSQADKKDVIEASVKSSDQPTLKRRNRSRQTALASRRDSNRQRPEI